MSSSSRILVEEISSWSNQPKFKCSLIHPPQSITCCHGVRSVSCLLFSPLLWGGLFRLKFLIICSNGLSHHDIQLDILTRAL